MTMGTMCGFLLLVAASALLVASKPYSFNDDVEKSHIFRGEFVLPPNAPLSYVDSDKDRGRWMSWRPRNSDPTQASGEESKSAEKSKEEIKEESKAESKEESKEESGEQGKRIPQTPIITIHNEDPCKTVYCHYGRVCRKNLDGRGECVCADESYCRGHKKEVCGTDGTMYPSHCELHRMACVKGIHIGVDHAERACHNPPEEEHIRVEHVVPDDHIYPDIFDNLNGAKPAEPDMQVKMEPLDQSTTTTTTTTTLKPANFRFDKVFMEDVKDKPLCSPDEYERFKGNLLHYHCARIGETNCGPESNRRQFVANIMFSYYDRNDNQVLDNVELEDIEHRDHLEKLSRFCQLPDMLVFEEVAEDKTMAIHHFYKAFNIPSVILKESLKVFTTQVSAGNSIELKCDIKGAEEIIWKRNTVALSSETSADIKTFADGSLYISNLGLHHMGNYTCQDRYNEHVVQTHVVRIQVPPTVRVNPSTQFHTSGATVVLKCHADGVPEPELSWEMNESPLPDDPEGKHYVMLQKNATLEIRQAVYTKDTGAYKCKAHNAAGVGQDIGTVFIENSRVPTYSSGEAIYEVFVVFHDQGYTAYEPSHCHIEHQVQASFSMFKILPEYGDTLKTLCPENGSCSWGTAVNVKNKYIYVAQPKQNRVVVIEIQDRSNPVEIIPTDKIPVEIHYIEHLDQVWILCWNEENALDAGTKTVVVVRQASEDLQHHIVHTQPIANRFDLVQEVFLPPNNDMGHKFQHGYVVHTQQQALYKLHLEGMKYTKMIDLHAYSCVPKSIAFISLGGQVIVHCEAPAGQPAHSQHLVLDYVTDAVLSQKDINGAPYVSPDGRYLVIIDEEGDTVSVNKIQDTGKIEKMYDEYTNLHISDITFFPSDRGRSYDLYASSANKNDVLYLSLASGKVEMIEGVGQAIPKNEWKWSKSNRVIRGGGMFGEYLMTPSRDSVVIIDGRRRHVQCEWQDIKHGNVIVWVDPLRL